MGDLTLAQPGAEELLSLSFQGLTVNSSIAEMLLLWFSWRCSSLAEADTTINNKLSPESPGKPCHYITSRNWVTMTICHFFKPQVCTVLQILTILNPSTSSKANNKYSKHPGAVTGWESGAGQTTQIVLLLLSQQSSPFPQPRSTKGVPVVVTKLLQVWRDLVRQAR